MARRGLEPEVVLRRVGEPEGLEVGRVERGPVVRRGAVVGVVGVEVGLRSPVRVPGSWSAPSLKFAGKDFEPSASLAHL